MGPAIPLLRWLSSCARRGDIWPVAGPVVGLSLLVLLGWVLDIDWLQQLLPGWAPMPPLSAVGFLLCGLALPLYAHHRFAAAGLVCLPVAWLAMIAFAQYLGLVLPDMDTLIFRDDLLRQKVAYPGRMTPTTALEFLLFCLAIWLPRGSRACYRAVRRIATLGLIVVLASLAVYVVGIHTTVSLGPFGAVTAHGALNFALLFLGLLLLQRSRNWLHFLLLPTPGATVVRSMLGYILAWPLAVGLAIALFDPELRSPRLDLALALMLVMLILAAFALRFGKRLDRALAERAQVATALRASEARLAGIVASAMDAIITIDSEQRIVLFNAAAEKLFGCSTEEVLGTGIERFVPARARAGHSQQVRRFGKTGTTSREMGSLGTLTAVRRDGSEFPIEASISQVVVDGQKLFTVILRDISERVRAEAEIRRLNADLERRVGERTAELAQTNEALLRSNQELQQFAHIAAHDLQTPLRSISGFAQLLQTDLRDRLAGEQSLYLRQMVDNTRRMHALIQDLLAYSQLGSAAHPFARVDCNALVDEVRAALSAVVAESGAEVTRGDLPIVHGDRTMLMQLFQNLIDNGIKYHGEAPPRVHVAAEENGSEWIFSVADNGIGIDPRHHERIFGVFRRLHTLKDYPGTGIGLSICRRVVEHHGGRIWVESEPGRGSTFRFALPRPAAELSAPG